MLLGLKSKLEKIGTNVSISNNVVTNMNSQQEYSYIICNTYTNKATL